MSQSVGLEDGKTARRKDGKTDRKRAPYASSRELCKFADALRDCLDLDPMHHDMVTPKLKNAEQSDAERFYRTYEWPDEKPSI